ncbi:MAG: hypothetical protein ACI4XR_00650, partial [Bacilli bacterium]
KYTCNIDYTLPSNEGSGAKYTIYGHAKDKVGNLANKESKEYTMYAYCDETQFSSYGSWGTCSASCGGGTKTRTVYKNDYYFSSHSCDENQSESCNTMLCCSSTYTYGTPTYGSCSNTCGTGTRSVRYTKRSNYDDSYCGTDTSYESCTDDSGCSSGGGSSETCTYSDTINGNRCYNGSSVYVTTCQPTSCPSAKCNTSVGTVLRNSLKTSGCSTSGGGSSSSGSSYSCKCTGSSKVVCPTSCTNCTCKCSNGWVYIYRNGSTIGEACQ